jgi:hypothetical protein
MLVKNITAAQLEKTFDTYHGTRRLIAAVRRAHL